MNERERDRKEREKKRKDGLVRVAGPALGSSLTPVRW